MLTQKGRTAFKERLEDNILNYKRRLSNLEEKDLELLSRSLENIKRVLSKIKIDDLWFYYKKDNGHTGRKTRLIYREGFN